MKAFLEPRWTEKGLKSINFAHKLVYEFKPDCIDFAVDNLTVHQVRFYFMSLSILKTLIPESCRFDKPVTKFHVLTLLLKMATSMESFLKRAKTWTHVNYPDLSSSLGDYVQRNFPDGQVIFTDWDEVCDDLRISDYLDVAFDL